MVKVDKTDKMDQMEMALELPMYLNTRLYYKDHEEIKIDRKQEDKDVVEYQINKDSKLLEKVYLNRVSSIKVWARKFYFLSDSYEDMEGELRYYFYKAIMEYDNKRGSFNTCLYTFFRNCIRNILISKNAKKRRPLEIKSNLTNFVLSLDYGWNKSKEENCSEILYDKIIDYKYKSAEYHMTANETINLLSRNDGFIKSVFTKIGNGSTLSSVLKDAKIRNGKIDINKQQKKILMSKKNKKVALNIIKNEIDVNKGFSVVNYEVVDNKMHYIIEMKKTKESDSILKAIRKLRKNEKEIREKIGV